jgi:tetrahydromethanopterin:alpha-L-glutamate ligase
VLHNPCVAIVTDDPGWHGCELRQAFAARGYDSVYISLIECWIDLSDPRLVILPGFERETLPIGVFVRGIPGGTLEQVTLRLDVLHGLRELGSLVYNDARAIERTVDKAMTSFLLKRAGIPTPDTWICESEQQARAIVIRELGRGKRIVMKPLFGSQGIGVTLIETPAALPAPADFGGVFYLQSFIERPDLDWRDWRVFVIGGRAQAAMLRRNDYWITNRAQGGRCELVVLGQELAGLAEDAVRAVNMDYAGVDLLEDEEGRLVVTEINSIPAWLGLQGVCSFSIAERLVDHFLSRIAASRALEVVP